jgi:phospholipase/carboxylesterase
MNLSEWPHEFRAGEQDAPVLLSLHGTGGDEHDGLALGLAVDPRATVLAPRGRVSERGANRWFRRLAEGVFDVDDVEARADELAEFAREATSHYDLAGALVGAGFSNGANMALATALRHPGVLGRAIAFSGMYPFGDREPQGTVILDLLLLNGAEDPMAPSTSVDRLEATATARGASVTRVTRAGGHGIPAAEFDTAREWLAAH